MRRMNIHEGEGESAAPLPRMCACFWAAGDGRGPLCQRRECASLSFCFGAIAADPFSGLTALPDGCCQSSILAPLRLPEDACSSRFVLALVPCEKLTLSLTPPWIIFLEAPFPPPPSALSRVLILRGTNCAVMSAASSSALVATMRRLHAAFQSCPLPPDFIRRSCIFFYCQLCSAFQILLSLHSNLSCSPSFYTLQPLICIFLLRVTPVFLYSLYCLQPAAPRLPCS